MTAAWMSLVRYVLTSCSALLWPRLVCVSLVVRKPTISAPLSAAIKSPSSDTLTSSSMSVTPASSCVRVAVMPAS